MCEHGALAVGRYERHALSRTLRAAEDVRLDVEIAQRLLEEVTRGVVSHLADEARVVSERGEGADRISGRAAEREGVGRARHGLRDGRLQFAVHKIHRTLRQRILLEYRVVGHVDEHVGQGVAYACYSLHAGVFGCCLRRCRAMITSRVSSRYPYPSGRGVRCAPPPS